MKTVTCKLERAKDEKFYSINGKSIAEIWMGKDGSFLSEMPRFLDEHGCAQQIHLSEWEAHQYIRGCITNHLDKLGLCVKFKED